MEKTMNDYILETPEVVLSNLKKKNSLTRELVNLFFEKEYKDICIIASGSSYNAAVCARPFMRKVLKKEIKIIPPFTFENYEFDVLDDSFTVVISQSGCSTNSISALKKLKSLGKPAIGITGNMESDFKYIADYCIDYGVGIETVGYVTKGVVTLAEFLMLFSLETAINKGTIDKKIYNELLKQIELTAQAHKSIYKSTETFIKHNYKNLTSMKKVFICGSGPNYGTAIEAALKISETVLIPAVALETEEFLHGPSIQVAPDYTVFFVDNNDQTSKRTVDIFNATRCITDNTYIISNNIRIDDKHAIRSEIETNTLVSPLYNLGVFELIAFKVTDELNKWRKHPLFYEFMKNISSKSERYIDTTLNG